MSKTFSELPDRRDLAFVLWAHSNFGGMERRYTRLAAYLSKHLPGVRVSLFVRRGAEDTAKKFLGEDSLVRLVVIGGRHGGKSKIARALRDLFELVRMLSTEKPHHVHVIQNPGVISGVVARTLGKRRPVSFSMVSGTYQENTGAVGRLFAKISCTYGKSIDCLSEGTRDILLNTIGRQGGAALKVAPCSFTDYSKTSVSSRKDIDVLMMARFVTGKGYDLVEKIKDDMSDLEFHVCGFGPLQVDMDTYNVYNSTDPFNVMSRSKIFLSIQASNNYPSQSALEAMASQCAIIATDVGETRKFLDEHCAILIPNDAGSLRNAIQALMQDPERLEALGRNARARVLNEHTVERYASYFMDEIVGWHNPYYNRA